MSRYRGVLSGPKFSGRGHTTFLDAAYPVLMAAKDAEEVKRIVVSVICSGKGSGKKIKISDVPNGLRVTVKGNGAVQEFFVYTSDGSKTKAFLEEAWQRAQ